MKPSLAELKERDLLGVAKLCARAHGVTLEEMLGRRRFAAMAAARRDFYRELVEERGWSANAVGKFVGRDHASILLALGGLARCELRSGARAFDLAQELWRTTHRSSA